MMDKAAIDRLATAVHALYDPNRRLAEAVSAVFADAAKRDGTSREQELHLRLVDGLARHREFQARQQAKYGDVEALALRMSASGGMPAARIWC
jgi:hypothetical protein